MIDSDKRSSLFAQSVGDEVKNCNTDTRAKCNKTFYCCNLRM
jgi:hypothetical protein